MYIDWFSYIQTNEYTHTRVFYVLITVIIWRCTQIYVLYDVKFKTKQKEDTWAHTFVARKFDDIPQNYTTRNLCRKKAQSFKRIWQRG